MSHLSTSPDSEGLLFFSYICFTLKPILVTVNRIYNLVMSILDKNSGQGYVSTTEFNDTINIAQYGFQNYLKGEIQQYQNGRPISRIDYSQNEKIRQQMSPCVYNAVLSTLSGSAMYPPDFILVDAMLTSDNKQIRFISQDRLANFLADTIDPISENPGYTIDSQGFTFYPSALSGIKCAYVRKAREIKYATTLDVNGREIYDAVNSIDPIWSELDCFEIVVRALAVLGVPMQLAQVQNYARDIKLNGQ